MRKVAVKSVPRVIRELRRQTGDPSGITVARRSKVARIALVSVAPSNFEVARHEPQIVVVLHTTVGHSELHHPRSLAVTGWLLDTNVLSGTPIAIRNGRRSWPVLRGS
jgi:hypothetical protein